MSTTIATSGETVYLGDLVKVVDGAIVRRATKDDIGLAAGEDPRTTHVVPPSDIHIWNGLRAVPFQEAMSMTYDIQAKD